MSIAVFILDLRTAIVWPDSVCKKNLEHHPPSVLLDDFMPLPRNYPITPPVSPSYFSRS